MVRGLPLLVLALDAHENRVQPASHRSGTIRSVIIGVVMTAVVLLVFGSLLASADPIFGEFLDGGLSVDVLAEHGFKIMFGTCLVSCGLWLALFRSGVELPSQGRLHTGRIGRIEHWMVFGALAVLFAGFIASQLGALFGGDDYVRRVAGLSYAQYARQGFFQLVAVVALLIPLLMSLDWLRDDEPGTRKAFRIGVVSSTTLVVMIAASAVQRLFGYVEAYGLTEFRLYALAALTWAVLVVAAAAGLMYRGDRTPAAAVGFGAGLAILLAINVLNPEALIARINVDKARVPGENVITASREVSGRHSMRDTYDESYSLTLSADAVPTLVARIDSINARDRREVARTLVSRWGRGNSDPYWTWDYSRARARRAVREELRHLDVLALSPRKQPGPRLR